MNLLSPLELIEVDFDFFVDTIKTLQTAGDFVQLEKILGEFINKDLDKLSLPIQAFINYSLGYFYIYNGKAKNIHGYQEKGKDALSRAIEIYSDLGLYKEKIESETVLGWSYYQEGRIENFEIFLETSIQNVNEKDEVYYFLKVNQLNLYYKEVRINEALEIIDKIKFEIEKTCNIRLLCQFYSCSGLIHRSNNNYELSFSSFISSIKYAQKLRNQRLEGQALNSLAYCHSYFKQFNLALEAVNDALNIFNKTNDLGLKADCLDTKAMILFSQNDLEAALKTIIKAIAFFRESESYLSYAECLWNKILILFKLKKGYEIIETWAELSKVAYEHLEPSRRNKFISQFEEMIIFPFGDSYKEKIEVCQKNIIQPVLDKSDGIVEASRKLGFGTHHTLSNIIKRVELDYQTRKVRSDKYPLHQVSYSGDVICPGYLNNNSEKFAIFQNYSDELLLVYQTTNLVDKDTVIMKEHVYFIAEVVVEDDSYYLVNQNGSNVHKTAKYIGKIIGRTNPTELNKSEITFQKV